MNANPPPGELEAPSSLPVRAIHALVRLGGILSTLLILVSLVVLSYAVVQRYILAQPLLWADELLGYLLVAIVMLGAAEALRKGDHVAIDLLAERAGPRGRRLIRIWSDVAVLAFAAVLGWSSWNAIRFAYDFGSYSSGYIEMAAWIPQLPMLAGCVLLALTALMRILQTLIADPGK